GQLRRRLRHPVPHVPPAGICCWSASRIEACVICPPHGAPPLLIRPGPKHLVMKIPIASRTLSFISNGVVYTGQSLCGRSFSPCSSPSPPPPNPASPSCSAPSATPPVF